MRTASIGAVVLSAVLLAACITRPLLNVENALAASPAGTPLTAEQVRAAVMAAGVALNWTVTDAGPGKLTATHVHGKASVEIEIPYSAAKYSLLYKSSEGMRAEGGQIHKLYNQWIQALTRGINVQIAAY